MLDIYLGEVVRKYPNPLSAAPPCSTHGLQVGAGCTCLVSGEGWVPALQCTYLQHTSVNFPSLQRRLGGLLSVAQALASSQAR